MLWFAVIYLLISLQVRFYLANSYVTIPLAGYNAGGVTFIAAPRNGSTLQDFVDGVVPLNNGASWLYYRLRLRSASTPTSTPTPSRVPSTSPTPIATSTSSPVPTASPAPTFTPTSTPTPTQQYYIYGDSLASGWVNKSHQSSINIAGSFTRRPVYIFADLSPFTTISQR